MNKYGYSIWFTGLSGSGKSAIADELAFALKDAGLNVQRIDEDVILNDVLKKEYTSLDNEVLLVRIAIYISSLLTGSNFIPIISTRLSQEELRSYIRESVPDSLLVYTKCRNSECEERDPHQLYAMVKDGRARDIPGVDGIFEEPSNADIVLNTFLDDIKACTKAIIGYLDFNGYLKVDSQSTDTSSGYTNEQEATIKKRLEDLGYL